MLPWPPPPATSFSLEWAGLVRTCLQPAFLPSGSEENYSLLGALDFLKPDQRWDPAGALVKSQQCVEPWSFRGETRNQRRAHPRLGLQGSEARECGNLELEWAGGWGLGQEHRFKGSQQSGSCFGWRCCSFNTETPTTSGAKPNSLQSLTQTNDSPLLHHCPWLTELLFVTADS